MLLEQVKLGLAKSSQNENKEPHKKPKREVPGHTTVACLVVVVAVVVVVVVV